MSVKDLVQQCIRHKESRETHKALISYQYALDIAETPEQKDYVWQHILHIHTDKMLSVLMEIAELYDTNVFSLVSEKGFRWEFGTNRFAPDKSEPEVGGKYHRPSEESLFT